MSDTDGNYYEVGAARVLDWGISESWSGGGWVRLEGHGKMALAGILEMSDHYLTTAQRWGK